MNAALWQWQVAYHRLRASQQRCREADAELDRARYRIAENELRYGAATDRYAEARDRHLDAVGRLFTANAALDLAVRRRFMLRVLLVDWLVFCALGALSHG